MAIVIGLLTFLLVFVSLFLILLVLVQLPKKEAGVGMAFGAGMSEMLLGAGSGNILTRITKYTVGLFLVLSLLLAILRSSEYRNSGLGVTRAIEENARTAPQKSTVPAPAGPTFQALPGMSNVLSNPEAPATNVAPPPAPPVGGTNASVPLLLPETLPPAGAPPGAEGPKATPPAATPPTPAPANPSGGK